MIETVIAILLALFLIYVVYRVAALFLPEPIPLGLALVLVVIFVIAPLFGHAEVR